MNFAIFHDNRGTRARLDKIVTYRILPINADTPNATIELQFDQEWISLRYASPEVRKMDLDALDEVLRVELIRKGTNQPE